MIQPALYLISPTLPSHNKDMKNMRKDKQTIKVQSSLPPWFSLLLLSLSFHTHPLKVQEPTSEDELAKDRADKIKRLWEPYETETFNLKALIGDASAIDEMVKERRRRGGERDIVYFYSFIYYSHQMR